MTDGSVFQRKDGRWCAKYQDHSGKTRYLYRRTKAEAKTALRAALADRDNGIVPPSQITVGVVVEGWLEELREEVSLRTWINRESIVRHHIIPTLGDKKLEQLSDKDIRGLYKSRLSLGLSSATVKRIHIILTQTMRFAQREKFISRNPLENVKAPREVRKEPEILTTAQVKHLLEIVRGDRFELAYVLGATMGLRIGECLALRHEDVHLDNGTISIRHTLWRGETWNPKTDRSRRTLKLPKIALETFQRHRIKQEGWLFPTCNDNPVDPSNFWTCSWQPMLERAGLPSTISYHKLRHGAVSFLLSQGVPVPIVSKYAGHANPATTYRFYAHIIDGSDGLAADGIDEALG